MEDIKKYWAYILVFGVGCFALGYFLHTPPEPLSTKTDTVTTGIQVNASIKADSVHTERSTRIVSQYVAPSNPVNARGWPISHSDSCYSFYAQITLPDSTGGYYILTMDTVDCASQSVFGVRISHSPIFVQVTDSSKTDIHREFRMDSSSWSYTRDSTAIIARHSLYNVAALFSLPVFSSGVFSYDPLEIMLQLSATYHLGQVLALGLRPAIPIRSPLSISTWQVNVDCSFDLFHKDQ